MKITIASSGLGTSARGIEAWAQDLARALHARGAQVTLLRGAGLPATPWEVTIPSTWPRTAEKTRRLLRWLPRRFFWRLGLGNVYDIEQTTFALGVIKHLRKSGADVFHVQDPWLALIVQTAGRLGLIRAITVLSHGTEESVESLSRIQYLLHLTAADQRRSVDAGLSRKEWQVIPNFVDETVFHPGKNDALREELRIPLDHVVVLTVAAIRRPHKRIDYFLAEAARAAQASPVPVTFVVAGGEEVDTKELIVAGEALLGDRVRFLVNFPRARMPELFRAADIFVLASLFEMMPIALLETTASGLPSVVHSGGVMKWITGEGGLAVDLSQTGAMSGALHQLLADPGLRKTLGEAARARCVQQFSSQRVVDDLLAYYQRIIR